MPSARWHGSKFYNSSALIDAHPLLPHDITIYSRYDCLRRWLCVPACVFAGELWMRACTRRVLLAAEPII